MNSFASIQGKLLDHFDFTMELNIEILMETYRHFGMFTNHSEGHVDLCAKYIAIHSIIKNIL